MPYEKPSTPRFMKKTDVAQLYVAVSQDFEPKQGLSSYPGQSKPWALRDAYARYSRVEAGSVSLEQLYTVHNPDYVDGVLSKRFPDGYGERNDASLEQIRAAVGAFVKASHLALDHNVAFAPVSGFHHAGHEFGGGFCTFNGLLIAAAEMKHVRGLKNILIIDGDAHFGNGTEDILERELPSLPYVKQLTHERNLTKGGWKQEIEDAINEKKWDLIMYQAGADAWVHDEYLSGYLNEEGLKARDHLVFWLAYANRIPVVWNCAGGYNGTDTLRLHANTMAEMEKVYLAKDLAGLEV